MLEWWKFILSFVVVVPIKLPDQILARGHTCTTKADTRAKWNSNTCVSVCVCVYVHGYARKYRYKIIEHSERAIIHYSNGKWEIYICCAWLLSWLYRIKLKVFNESNNLFIFATFYEFSLLHDERKMLSAKQSSNC